PADQADRQVLGHVLRDRHQARHRLERLQAVVQVQPRDDDPQPAVGQRLADLDDPALEEMSFVDADDLGSGADAVDDVRGAAEGDRGDADMVVGDEVLAGVADVELVLEDLDFLAGEGGEAEAADEFVGLSGEHRAADDFDPAASSRELMHGCPEASIIGPPWRTKRKRRTSSSTSPGTRRPSSTTRSSRRWKRGSSSRAPR